MVGIETIPYYERKYWNIDSLLPSKVFNCLHRASVRVCFTS